MSKPSRIAPSAREPDCNSVAWIHSRKKSSTWDNAFPIPEPPDVVAVLVVVASAVACFSNSWDGDFVFDDSEAIVNNADMRPNAPLSGLFHNDFWGTRLTDNNSHKSYRPLTVLSFRLNLWLSGGQLRPWGFRFANSVLHAVVSALALPTFQHLLGGRCPRAAFLAAWLFAVHPIHAEAVAGIVGRADLLCALLSLLSFLSFASACQGGQRNLLALTSSAGLAAAATLCKEQGITILGLCSAYDILIVNSVHPLSLLPFFRRVKGWNVKKATEGWLRRLALRQAFLATAGLALLAFRLRLMGSGPPTFHDVDNPASFHPSRLVRTLSYNHVYALNGWLLLCPAWLCFDWSMGCVPLVTSLADKRNAATLAFWVALLGATTMALGLHGSRTRRCFVVSVALTAVSFLPAANVVFRVGFVIAERVLYVPSAGACLLVAIGLRQAAVARCPRIVLQACYLFLVVVFAARSFQRSAEWRTETALFESALDVCPLNAKVHYNAAKSAGDAGQRDLAESRYRRAITLHPRYDQAMNNLANLLRDQGRLAEAQTLLARAVQIRPEFAAAWMNLGIVLTALNRLKEAEASYRMALRHRNNYPDCYYNLGNMFLEQKQHAAAMEAWLHATRLRPTHAVSWNNMIILLDSVGETERAVAVAQEALKALPNDPALHFHMANALGKAARYVEAERHFIRALLVDPDNPSYHSNLGVLYHRWKKHALAKKSYLRAIELDPALKSARDNLKMLEKSL